MTISDSGRQDIGHPVEIALSTRSGAGGLILPDFARERHGLPGA